MKIDAKKLENKGIRITEEIHGALLETPIKLESLDGMDFDDLMPGNYDINLKDEEVYSDGCEIFFSVYEEGDCVLESVPFNDILDYLKKRFG